jgi:hypothetical protein
MTSSIPLTPLSSYSTLIFEAGNRDLSLALIPQTSNSVVSGLHVRRAVGWVMRLAFPRGRGEAFFFLSYYVRYALNLALQSGCDTSPSFNTGAIKNHSTLHITLQLRPANHSASKTWPRTERPSAAAKKMNKTVKVHRRWPKPKTRIQ